MMDKREKYSMAALAALVALTAILKLRKHPSIQPNTLGGVDDTTSASGGGAAAQSQFDAPYQYPSPGISDSPIVLNGGAPFQSSISVEVNPSYLGTLSENYIPLFGFVGMGPGSGGPNQISAPPPAPAYFAPQPASSPYAAPPTYTQPSPFHAFTGSGGGGAQLAARASFGG